MPLAGSLPTSSSDAAMLEPRPLSEAWLWMLLAVISRQHIANAGCSRGLQHTFNKHVIYLGMALRNWEDTYAGVPAASACLCSVIFEDEAALAAASVSLAVLRACVASRLRWSLMVSRVCMCLGSLRHCLQGHRWRRWRARSVEGGIRKEETREGDEYAGRERCIRAFGIARVSTELGLDAPATCQSIHHVGGFTMLSREI